MKINDRHRTKSGKRQCNKFANCIGNGNVKHNTNKKVQKHSTSIASCVRSTHVYAHTQAATHTNTCIHALRETSQCFLAINRYSKSEKESFEDYICLCVCLYVYSRKNLCRYSLCSTITKMNYFASSR